jgi:1,4-dihydroxy-2-naphthoyl-CoA hydrolase
MIWFKKYSLETINAQSKGNMSEHLDIQFIDIQDDMLVADMPVDHRTKQPAGLLNGGASCVLIETIGSVASLLCVNTDLFFPVGTEINASHLKAAKSGRVTAYCRPIKCKGTIHSWDVEIKDEKGELTCKGRLSTMILKRSSFE